MLVDLPQCGGSCAAMAIPHENMEDAGPMITDHASYLQIWDFAGILQVFNLRNRAAQFCCKFLTTEKVIDTPGWIGNLLYQIGVCM